MNIDFRYQLIEIDKDRFVINYYRKRFKSGFEINGCPVVADNQNYDEATKLC